MLSNKFGVIAGAAMLGTAALLGTNAANAVIDLDATAKANPAVTFAKETLMSKVSDDSMYYVVAGGTNGLHVMTALGVAGAGADDDDLIITVTLEGMVFNTPLADATLTGVGGPISKASGGAKGEMMAVYTAKRGSGNSSTSELTLELVDLGVMPDGGGSISVSIVNLQQRALLQNIEGVESPGMKTASYSNPVGVVSGIKGTASPMSPTATVANSFQSFGMTTDATPVPNLMATVGSFMLGLGTETGSRHLNAANGSEVTALNTLVDIGNDGTDPTGTDSTVTFTGDFSFADHAWLDDAATCANAPGDVGDGLLIRDSDGEVSDTSMLKSVAPATVEAAHFLCIRVPAHTDEMPVSIPETEEYMVETKYMTAITGSAFPASPGSYALGMIMRNGTTVQIPVVMVSEDQIHRITLRNRGGADAKYTIQFMPPDGTTADPEMVDGTVEANSVMELKAMDLVTLTGKRRTAATVIVEAPPGNIDVASQIQRMSTGDTDTIVHD